MLRQSNFIQLHLNSFSCSQSIFCCNTNNCQIAGPSRLLVQIFWALARLTKNLMYGIPVNIRHFPLISLYAVFGTI